VQDPLVGGEVADGQEAWPVEGTLCREEAGVGVVAKKRA
jgi:hypothetical protein